MRRSRLVLATLFLWMAAGISAATAQSSVPAVPPGLFRVEEDSGAPTRGALAGWLYYDGRETVGLVRMRLDVLDDSGNVIAVQRGWAYGNLRAGDRAYFRIPLPDRQGTRRILVESYVIQSVQSP